MKKYVLSTLLITSVLALSACGEKPTSSEAKPDSSSDAPVSEVSSGPAADTNEPMIMGVQLNLSCEAGKEFDLLTGISAIDDVDGDITSRIQVSTMPSLPVVNGVVTPGKDDTGTYDVAYRVTDAAGNETVEYSELTVTPALGEKVLVHDYDFAKGTEGWSPDIVDPVVGTHGISRGKYVFDVSESDGTDWHVKYAYYNYEVKAGHKYVVTFNFETTVAGKVMVNGAEKNVSVGHNSLSTVMEANVDSAKNIEIQFGKLEGPFKVSIESIEIKESASVIDEEKTKEVEVVSKGSLTEDWTFDKDNWHCEYSAGETVTADIEKAADHATVTQKSSGPGWAGKFLVQTKAKLLAGIEYTVSIKYVASANVSGLEFGYGGWADDFKKWNELYGQSLTAGEAKVYTFKVTPEEDFDNPMVCLKMGGVEAGVSITASEFSVTYDTGSASSIELNSVASAWSETENRNVVKESSATSVTTKLTGEAEGTWQASTNLDLNNVVIEANKTYRATVDLESSVDLDKVNYMMGKPAWDPDSCFITGESITLKAGEAKTVTAIFTASESLSHLQARVKYGHAPDGTEFTVSNFKLEEIEYVASDAVSILPENYNFNLDEFAAHAEGDYKADIAKADDVVTFTSVHQGDCWHAFAIVEPRVTLTKGTNYRISIDVETSVDVTGFEVGAGYRDGDFKQFGHEYSVKLSAGVKQTFTFNYACDGNQTQYWGVGVFMGTAPVGSTVKLSNLVVEEVPAAEDETTTTFNFVPENISQYANADVGAASELYVENGVLVYDITALNHESDWANKMTVSNLVLGGLKKYTIEIVVKADKAVNASIILNKQGDWDVRARAGAEITTEYQTITLETPVMTADLKFELLFQDLHQNTNVDSVRIEFESIKVFSQETEGN